MAFENFGVVPPVYGKCGYEHNGILFCEQCSTNEAMHYRLTIIELAKYLEQVRGHSLYGQRPQNRLTYREIAKMLRVSAGETK